MKIEIIDMVVNVDHVHLFIEYPPKYSVSFIAKRIKGRSSRELHEAFPHLKEWAGIGLWAPPCFHGSVGHGWGVVGRYMRRSQMRSRYIRALYFSVGFSDCGADNLSSQRNGENQTLLEPQQLP